MLFPTLDYLLFLPLCVWVYWALPQRARLSVLGIASLVFYASWKLAYVPLILAITGAAWGSGRWLARLQRQQEDRGRALAISVALLLIPLLIFKYWNWLSTDFESVMRAIGLPIDLPDVALPLPVGISFFTFQALAYVIDAGRTGEAEKSPWRFTAFITFFPQLIAGPIVRKGELLPQLEKLPLLGSGHVGAGLFRITRGMVKKILFADVLRVGIVDPMFLDPSRFTGLELMIGLYAYTLQIYYDFSGYTDIAIGSARLFGIELPENFRRPYKATSVAGFWRRWHITLSNWVRDYIYYAMGGARVTPWRIYANIMLTLIVIGVWHGASWNFVVYGTLHGLGVAINRAIRARTGRRPGDALTGRWAWIWRFLLTFHFVVVARILFRSPDLSTSWAYFIGLFDTAMVLPRFSTLAWIMFFLGYAIHFSPDGWQKRAETWFKATGPAGWALIVFAAACACVLLGTGEQLAFVYYQF